MDPPQQVKDCPSGSNKQHGMTISYFVQGDQGLENKIRELSKSEDDPPLLINWNPDCLHEFWDKAVAYGAGGGNVLPPSPIFNGIHPVGPFTSQSIQLLEHGILSYVANLTGTAVIRHVGNGGNIGLACSMIQFCKTPYQLGQLKDHPWFQAVLATGAPLTGTLATLYMPRARNTAGLCDPVILRDLLWA